MNDQELTQNSYPVIAGIHLSGPNSQRTAVIVLAGHPLIKPLKIIGLYEKIGSQGKLFSDELLVDVLKYEARLDRVFVDCPISLPPCVACLRPVCPGVVECEDVSVAYMQALAQRLRRQGARKKRPINPQSQRLWDIAFQAESDRMFEPTYSANLAPLVIRARTLQRRLNLALPHLQLFETSVSHGLQRLCLRLGMKDDTCEHFRSFERGKLIRSEIVKRMIAQHWVDEESVEDWSDVWTSVDTFQAFITAVTGAFVTAGMTQLRPLDFLESEGWVFLPEFNNQWPLGHAKLNN